MTSTLLGRFELEEPEIIRLNRLVHHRIDYGSFKRWYDSLPVPQQTALATALYHFAHQAGHPQMYEDALPEAGLSLADLLVRQAASFHQPYRSLNLVGFHDWFAGLSDADRLKVFHLVVYLFGKADARRLQGETKETCNHWWHRDYWRHRDMPG